MRKHKIIYVVLLLLLVSLLVGGGVYASQKNNQDEYKKIMKIQKSDQQESGEGFTKPTISHIPRPTAEETNTP